MIVVDTNVIVYFIVEGSGSAAATELLLRDPEWHAPILWRSEFRNALALHIRLRKVPLSIAKEHMRAAELRMRDREHSVDSGEILECATQSGASAYDCEFVVLARKLGVLFVTADRKLARAFPDRARLLSEFVG